MPSSGPISTETDYVLIGTYTRYSSWTARVETVLEYFKIPYTKHYTNLSAVKSISPTGFVPVLKAPSMFPDIYINDSLAICEFLAELNPSLPLWPQDQMLRALARSAVAEMHSGFSVLRNTYDTNFVAKYSGNIPITEKGKMEVERMLKLWGEARARTVKRLTELGEQDEGFLFGKFGVADAFFWPVLWRFRTYDLPLATASSEATEWMAKMWSDPALKTLAKDYFRQADDPETTVAKYDDIFDGNPEIQYGRFDENWVFTASN
ncbi:Pyrimidodiazepine synthase [Hyphodiscus hymeniophilus]|uniref:Pyrimidodiazepine synthase n=1 Tax=Hyphodiscus hymeniophilus TaxID=353542 RepID=A0A9P6VQL0_9HELO|nr:Pyrimidodiazepine synthase [Hyphodiscus hymeniophilus]